MLAQGLTYLSLIAEIIGGLLSAGLTSEQAIIQEFKVVKRPAHPHNITSRVLTRRFSKKLIIFYNARLRYVSQILDMGSIERPENI